MYFYFRSGDFLTDSSIVWNLASQQLNQQHWMTKKRGKPREVTNWLIGYADEVKILSVSFSMYSTRMSGIIQIKLWHRWEINCDLHLNISSLKVLKGVSSSTNISHEVQSHLWLEVVQQLQNCERASRDRFQMDGTIRIFQ